MSERGWHNAALGALVALSVLAMTAMVLGVPRWHQTAGADKVRPIAASTGTSGVKMPPRRAPALTEEEIRRADLSLREAMFYEKLPGNEVRCGLCPRRCQLKDGERGACRARANIGGVLRTLVYGRLVAINNDPIEKKPLNHFLPGTRSLSIATAGCNLGCVFCQNWEISQAFPEKASHVVVSPEEVVAAAKRENCASIAYTYTEPTIFYEFMYDTAALARREGIRNVWVTCGYINPEPLHKLAEVMDAANIDLKGFSEEFYSEYCRATLAPVLETLVQARREGMWIEVTNLVIPGANDSPDMIRDMCAWYLENLGPDVPLHFSRFFPRYRLLDKSPTPGETLLQAWRIAREAGIHYVYIGNIALDQGRDTYCPNCGERLIVRKGYFIEQNTLRDGRCPKCGQPIAGVWK